MLLVLISIRFNTIWLTSRYFLCNCLKICINLKRCWHLLMIVLRLDRTALLGHPYCLFAIYYHAIAPMFCQYLISAKTLETKHTKMFTVLVLSLIVHHLIKILNKDIMLLLSLCNQQQVQYFLVFML